MSQSLALGASPRVQRPVRRRSIGGLRRAVSPLALLFAWEARYRLGVLPERTLAAPSAILVSAWRLALDGTLLPDLAVSLARVAAGFTLGALLGTVLATAR